ncbi:Uu.00g098860.m01.CDS01 [Anthostomella pinea]|uniref:Uu.00g098860.m01.CDS01 n=1 Tax=Anthostomella pinea TaxID=933095 RepID=A0AAI8VD82_9PEZI|nr:Uu.00g098860.m01.CDS01 [Anthostomella pinea]
MRMVANKAELTKHISAAANAGEWLWGDDDWFTRWYEAPTPGSNDLFDFQNETHNLVEHQTIPVEHIGSAVSKVLERFESQRRRLSWVVGPMDQPQLETALRNRRLVLEDNEPAMVVDLEGAWDQPAQVVEPALQDYQMQLMLLEQQNRKRLMKQGQEEDAKRHHLLTRQKQRTAAQRKPDEAIPDAPTLSKLPAFGSSVPASVPQAQVQQAQAQQAILDVMSGSIPGTKGCFLTLDQQARAHRAQFQQAILDEQARAHQAQVHQISHQAILAERALVDTRARQVQSPYAALSRMAALSHQEQPQMMPSASKLPPVQQQPPRVEISLPAVESRSNAPKKPMEVQLITDAAVPAWVRAWAYEAPERSSGLEHWSHIYTTLLSALPSTQFQMFAAWDTLADGQRAIVGTGFVHLYEGVAAIHCIIVKPEHRGKGVGKSLLGFGMQLAKDKGYKMAMVTATSSGLAMFRKFGFKEIGRVKLYALQPPKYSAGVQTSNTSQAPKTDKEVKVSQRPKTEEEFIRYSKAEKQKEFLLQRHLARREYMPTQGPKTTAEDNVWQRPATGAEYMSTQNLTHLFKAAKKVKVNQTPEADKKDMVIEAPKADTAVKVSQALEADDEDDDIPDLVAGGMDIHSRVPRVYIEIKEKIRQAVAEYKMSQAESDGWDHAVAEYKMSQAESDGWDQAESDGWEWVGAA